MNTVTKTIFRQMYSYVVDYLNKQFIMIHIILFYYRIPSFFAYYDYFLSKTNLTYEANVWIKSVFKTKKLAFSQF